MLKKTELLDPGSCLNQADDEEMLFVLLGRDTAAPMTIQYWCKERVKLGKNKWEDRQIQEALECAARMQDENELK